MYARLNKMNNWGLNNTYDYYEFAIDSLDNSGSGAGGYSPLNWPNFFVGGKNPLTRVRGMKILSAEIPFSYYVFTSVNNSFEVGTTESGTWASVSIPPGNYTTTTILTVLKNLIQSQIPGVVTVTYDSSTLKLVFTSDASLYLRFPEDGLLSPRLWIGFNAGVFGFTSAGSFTAPNVALLSGPNYLYINSIKIGQLTNNYIPTGFSPVNGNTGPQIAKVPVNVDSGEIIYYTDPDPQKYFDIGDSNSLQKLDFYLSLGTSETVLDLNGLSFSLKLALLLEKMNMDESMSGYSNQERVVKKMRPF